MSWTKKGMPTVSGYEQKGDNVASKRWLSFRINQVLDTGDPVWEYRGTFHSRRDICDFVIERFEYPMKNGAPTDKHTNNWFGGKCCHTITKDYWQSASETLRTLRLSSGKGVGDCEDVSSLHTNLFLMKRWRAFEVLGVVSQDGELLGGHGWSIFEDETGMWRLYEGTLSEAPNYPDGYPQIDPEATEWTVGGLTYMGAMKFDRRRFFQNEDAPDLFGFGMKDKETRAKHEAISAAWGMDTKAIKQAGLLSKIRWRR